MSLAQVLPILAALKKSTPDFAGGNTVDLSNGPSRLPQQPQGADVQLDPATGNIAQNPATQPSAPQGIGDISGSYDDQPVQAPKLATGTKLIMLLRSGLQGALNGMAQNAQTYSATGRNAGFGGGFYGAQEMPFLKAMQGQQLQRGGLENQLLGNQVQYSPLLQKLGILKTTTDINQTQAKTQLEQAQAEAANYKEDPNLGLIDTRTKQPVAGGMALAPLTDQEAAILGKNPGERVPLKLKNTANEMVNRGIRSVSAGGRQLLVDGQGNTIKDLGVATPMAVINATTGAFGNPASPEVQAIVDSVGQGKMDLPTALGSMRRNPAAAATFMGALLTKYPDYQQQNFGVSKKTMDYFTTGAGATQLTAFRTAIAHADLLDQAARALNNGDNRTLAGLNNRLQTEFGDSKMTTFDAIANAYNHEVGSVISKGHITDTEVKTGGATMPNNANYQTIHDVSEAYKQLMASKAQQLMAQYEQGLKAQPAFPQTNTPASGAVTHRYNPATKKIEAIP